VITIVEGNSSMADVQVSKRIAIDAATVGDVSAWLSYVDSDSDDVELVEPVRLEIEVDESPESEDTDEESDDESSEEEESSDEDTGDGEGEPQPVDFGAAEDEGSVKGKGGKR
jgi:hypothetical protein